MNESREAIARRLFDFFQRQPLKQGAFGKKYGLGSQGNVGHYLHARRPLALDAALRFVDGLKDQGIAVSLADISQELERDRQRLSGSHSAPTRQVAAEKPDPLGSPVDSANPESLSPAAQQLVGLIREADTSQSVSSDSWKHLAGIVRTMMQPTGPAAPVPKNFRR